MEQKVYITDASSGYPVDTFVFVSADEAKKLISSGKATSTETGVAEEEARKKAEKQAKSEPAKAEPAKPSAHSTAHHSGGKE